jgi:hypothetical protein
MQIKKILASNYPNWQSHTYFLEGSKHQRLVYTLQFKKIIICIHMYLPMLGLPQYNLCVSMQYLTQPSHVWHKSDYLLHICNDDYTRLRMTDQ